MTGDSDEKIKVHRNTDRQNPQKSGSRRGSRRAQSQAWLQQKNILQMENQVRWHGCDRPINLPQNSHDFSTFNWYFNWSPYIITRLSGAQETTQQKFLCWAVMESLFRNKFGVNIECLVGLRKG
jgi:hypothetical protein